MRVLVVDDEPLAIDLLLNSLSYLPNVEVVGVARDGDEAMVQVAATKPDLVLLDIQMPGQTGVEVARALSGRAAPEVVFVTAFAECAAEAFELDAADYLLKPVRLDRLAEAMKRARRRLDLQATHERLRNLEARLAEKEAASAGGYATVLWIKQRDGRVRVPVAEIRRIEADKDYALIHTGLKTHILRTTMRELEARLNPQQLLRVHRSAFVRLSCVTRVERNRRSLMRLHMEDGAVVEVGASYAGRVGAALGLEPGEFDAD